MRSKRIEEIRNSFPRHRFVTELLTIIDLLKAENENLKRIIAKEITENDELGCEYTYVITLKEENRKLKADHEKLTAENLKLTERYSKLHADILWAEVPRK